MSCNGCRVLRKGCSETCILRPCLQWIESPEAQGHATVFVAKFFGRAGLMSFISSVPENQRPALFQSLLFEACGRTVNPVNGAVGLLWTGNWHVCQAAVETVLRGGTLRPITEALGGILMPESDDTSEIDLGFTNSDKYSRSLKRNVNRLAANASDLDLSLTPGCSRKVSKIGGGMVRPATPSMNSEESVTTSLDSGGGRRYQDQAQALGEKKKLLNLFV